MRWFTRLQSETLELMAAAAQGLPADTVITNGILVNVSTGEIYAADVAIKGKYVLAVGDVRHHVGVNTSIVDADGRFLAPGFIETHMHVEGSHLSMPELAKVLIAHGTTVVSTDFCHAAIVAGLEAVKFLLGSLNKTPIKTFFVIPTSAYFQNRQLGFACTPFGPKLADLREMLDWPECMGIGETTYEILRDDPGLQELFQKARERGQVITGTGTGAVGKDLTAYLLGGGNSDHEMKSALETVAKARLGMYMHIREGSAASNLKETLKALSVHRLDARHFMFCTDEEDPSRLRSLGHIDYKMKLAVSQGLSPVTAIQMATINAADFFCVSDFFGSIAPGKVADIVLLDSLSDFHVSSVVADGKLMLREGQYLAKTEDEEYPPSARSSIRLEKDIHPADIAVHAEARQSATANAILAREGSLVSEHVTAKLEVRAGSAYPDVAQDVLKIVMVDRYSVDAKVGIGFIRGFGLREGAIAESFSPMSENIVAVGVDDESICLAVNRLRAIGGGQIVVRNGKTVALLKLPIFGLMSDGPMDAVVSDMRSVIEAAQALGCTLRSPFMTLGFMCVSPLGRLKISDRGLFDCEAKTDVPALEG